MNFSPNFYMTPSYVAPGYQPTTYTMPSRPSYPGFNGYSPQQPGYPSYPTSPAPGYRQPQSYGLGSYLNNPLLLFYFLRQYFGDYSSKSNRPVDVNGLIGTLQRFSPDGTFDSAEIQRAANSTSNSLTKEFFNKLDFQVRTFGRTVNAYDLQQVARSVGGDNLVTLKDFDNLPNILGWNRPAPANSVNFNSVSSAIRRFSSDDVFQSNEIQSAAGATADPLLKEVLNKLDFQARTYGRTVTPTDLQRVARFNNNDDFISLNDMDNLPLILNWVAIAQGG